MDREVIGVSDLHFRYSESSVLSGVTFEIEKGGITSLMGRNASGKTTLLKCISGIFGNYSGEIKIKGKDLRAYSRRELARVLCFVTQNNRHTFAYSILDYVMMGRGPHQSIWNTPVREDFEKAKYVLENLGIKDYENKSYMETSSGEGHLVHFARAMNQDTEIMLLDEPTSYLDFGNQIMIFGVIRRLCREFNKTVLMTLHNPAEMLNISDNVLILDGGRIRLSGKKEDIATGEILSELFGIQIEIRREGDRYFVFPE